MSLIAELQRRNVIRVGAAYIIAAWLLLQVTEVLVGLLELPAAVGKGVVLLLALGFIPAVVLSWIFELTPEGLKRESEVDRSQSITSHTGRRLNMLIIGMLALVAGYFIWESRFMDRPDLVLRLQGAERGSAGDRSAPRRSGDGERTCRSARQPARGPGRAHPGHQFLRLRRALGSGIHAPADGAPCRGRLGLAAADRDRVPGQELVDTGGRPGWHSRPH